MFFFTSIPIVGQPLQRDCSSVLRVLALVCSKLWVQFLALHKLGILVHTCNPITEEREAGKSEVPGHPGLHRKFKASLDYM